MAVCGGSSYIVGTVMGYVGIVVVVVVGGRSAAEGGAVGKRCYRKERRSECGRRRRTQKGR